MLLAFVPLFFAVASLTRATVAGAREQSARVLGRAIAAHVADARAERPSARAVEKALEGHAGWDGVDAICVFDARGTRLACAGSPAGRRRRCALRRREAPSRRRLVHGAAGRALDVVVARRTMRAVVTRVHLDDAGASGRLARAPRRALHGHLRAGAPRLRVLRADAPHRAPRRAARRRGRPRGERRAHAARPALGRARAHRARDERAVDDRRSSSPRRRSCSSRSRSSRRRRRASRRRRRSSCGASGWRASGRLAAGVAHEIGNPIAAIMGMEDLLLDGDLPRRSTQRDFVQRMRKETERIHTVLRDLLDFARPEERAGAASGAAVPGGRPTRRRRRRGARAAAEALPRRARSTSTSRASPRVALPAPRLTQVLLNLVLNAGAAVAAAKRDGGRVTVRARRRRRPRAHRGRGRRPRRRAGGPRPPLRAVRDDQGGRRGHGARPRGLPRARRVGRRRDRPRRDLRRAGARFVVLPLPSS